MNVDLEDAGAEPTAPALHPARVLAGHPGCAAGPERSKLEVPRAGAGNGRHPQGFKKLLQSGHSLHLVGGGSRQWQSSAECQVLNLTDSCLAAVYLVFGSLIQGVLDVGGQDKVRSQTRSELPWPEQATPAEGESSRDEGPAPEESQHDAPSHSRKRGPECLAPVLGFLLNAPTLNKHSPRNEAMARSYPTCRTTENEGIRGRGGGRKADTSRKSRSQLAIQRRIFGRAARARSSAGDQEGSRKLSIGSGIGASLLG